MAREDRDDQPSLELPSLFRRKRRPEPAPVEVRQPEPAPGRRRISLPAVGARPAAVLTGLLVGVLAVGLTWLALRGCSAVRDTSSCGGPGILVLLAIVVVVALAGRTLLRAWRVPDAGSTSFLAAALMTVLSILFLMGSLHDTWALVALPVLGAITFGLAQWMTSSNSAPGDWPR